MPEGRRTPAESREASSAKPFRGWPVEALEFLQGIELENNKSYWTAHKDLYQEKVLGPMTALLAEIAAEFGDGRVFRPYRDTRFSTDKSPYKTNIAAHNDAGYISLSADVLGVGTGLYMPSPDQLALFRAAVAHDRKGTELVTVVAALRMKHISVSAHQVLKTAPRGYRIDHPRIELLRHKGLTAWKEWSVGPWLSTTAPKQRVVDFLRTTSPFRKWFETNVAMDEPS